MQNSIGIFQIDKLDFERNVIDSNPERNLSDLILNDHQILVLVKLLIHSKTHLPPLSEKGNEIFCLFLKAFSTIYKLNRNQNFDLFFSRISITMKIV